MISSTEYSDEIEPRSADATEPGKDVYGGLGHGKAAGDPAIVPQHAHVPRHMFDTRLASGHDKNTPITDSEIEED